MIILNVFGETKEYDDLGLLLLTSAHKVVKQKDELKNSNFQPKCCLNDLGVS